MQDSESATADGIAYRLVRELEDLINLAGDAMRQANADGAEYEVEDELASARLAVKAYEKFCSETKGDSPAHACELNLAYDGSCLVCETEPNVPVKPGREATSA